MPPFVEAVALAGTTDRISVTIVPKPHPAAGNLGRLL